MNSKNTFLGLGFFLFLISCNSKSQTQNQTHAATKDTQSEVVDHHNSQNSLDWEGTYTGTLPCADCEGILTTLQLNNDNTFKKSTDYLGEQDGKFETTGTFTWSSDGNKIILVSQDGKEMYQVREGNLLMLDQEGQEVTGSLASHYILTKQ